MSAVPLLGVVDAKDVYDRTDSDAGSWGTQKSLVYTVAALRQVFRRPNSAIRWTATQNMFCDAGTKDMDCSHMRKILPNGVWSVEYCTDLLKTGKGRAAPKVTEMLDVNELPGSVWDKDSELVERCEKFSDTGFHKVLGEDQSVSWVHVARNAKSYRSPEPRLAPADFPLRTTVGCFSTADGLSWRLLERNENYMKLRNSKAQIPCKAFKLYSIFSLLQV